MRISKAPQYLRKHSQYTNSDYNYLSGRGWTNREIKARWDEEAVQGKAPCLHTMSGSAFGFAG